MRRTALTLTLFAFCFDVSLALAGRKHENNSTIEERLTHDRSEVRQFAILVREMEELNMPREKFDFWQINSELQTATKREYEQACEYWGDIEENDARPSPPDVQVGHSLGEPNFPEMSEDDPNRPRSTPAERVVRMKRIIRESKGLAQYMAMDEFDVLDRYHFLMQEFLELMRDDILQLEGVTEAVSPGRSRSQGGL